MSSNDKRPMTIDECEQWLTYHRVQAERFDALAEENMDTAGRFLKAAESQALRASSNRAHERAWRTLLNERIKSRDEAEAQAEQTFMWVVLAITLPVLAKLAMLVL